MHKNKVCELLGGYLYPMMKEGYLMNEEEREALLKVLRSSPDNMNMAIELVLQAGLLLSEAVVLKKEDINFAEGILSVKRVEIKCRIPDTTKYSHETIEYPDNCIWNILLSDEAALLLQRIIQINPFSEYLFEQTEKKHLNNDKVTRRLQYDCDVAGIPQKHAMALWMSWAIKQMEDGIDIQDVLVKMDRHHLIMDQNCCIYL